MGKRKKIIQGILILSGALIFYAWGFAAPRVFAQSGAAPTPSPTETLAASSRVGSTDGIFALATLILLIILLPLLWQMWRCRKKS